ncbi:MAG TPA: nucleoside monophosphate kinase [Candidatus Saccharimonadaceae bacterium]|nr:nucleoside monophosphate kinase [Candidatus Saccharimonadaceae bacterium]
MILMFGPVGAGKSVQGNMLAERQGWRWLSTGQMFRESNDAAVKARINRGDLIRDDETYIVLRGALLKLQQEGVKNIILDGFPRTREQAQWLVDHQTELDAVIDTTIVLDVPETELITRLMGRGRAEDTPETIKHRLDIYHQTTEPVLEVLTANNVSVQHINGVGSPEQVAERVAGAAQKVLG